MPDEDLLCNFIQNSCVTVFSDTSFD